MQVEKNFSADDFKVTRTVTSAHHGLRLDVFLMQFMGTLSRQFIQYKIKKGEIWIEPSEPKYLRKLTMPHRPSLRVFYGDHVFMYTQRKQMEDETFFQKPLALDEKITICFENEDFVAISKPPFMSAHPTGRHLFNCANLATEKVINAKVYSVHRLDRETSGLMLFAKNRKTAGNLITLFSEQKIKKTYFLISKATTSHAIEKPFWCNSAISIEKAQSGRLFAKLHSASASSKEASTFFYPLTNATTLPYAIFLAYPQTGRQHQIRAHIAKYHFPILGDKMYPDPQYFYRHKEQQTTLEDVQHLELNRQALHALAISFQLSGKTFSISTPLPLDLKNWLMEKNLLEHFENNIALKEHLYWNQQFASKYL